MLGSKQFCRLMGRLGITETDHVILYGNSAMMTITRAWLVFHVNGHARVSILNGNLHYWQQLGLPLTNQSTKTARSVYPPGNRLDSCLNDMAGVQRALQEQSHTLVNALSSEQFAGTGGAHYGHPGRIPGSIHLPARSFVSETTGRFRSVDELRRIVSAAGLTPNEPTIHYCGGGIAATTSAFVMAVLGDHRWSVYDNSLLEWSTQPDTPMVSG